MAAYMYLWYNFQAAIIGGKTPRAELERMRAELERLYAQLNK